MRSKHCDKGFRKDNEFYQELLELGVVNSQVQVRQVMDLLEDVEFGKVLNRVGPDYNAFNTFMKALKKTQKFAQDAYTAEDDFWKIFTFLGEQRKITDAYKAKGLQFGDDVVEVVTDVIFWITSSASTSYHRHARKMCGLVKIHPIYDPPYSRKQIPAQTSDRCEQPT